MPKQIYNEGRVTGLSAYEIFLQQHLATDPDTEPPTERQWLAASLGMGASMLIKIVKNKSDDIRTVDIPFPAGTALCASNTIIANLFLGKGDYKSGEYFANKVTDYGVLISNTASSSPKGKVNTENIGTGIPQDETGRNNWKDNTEKLIKSYIRIVDGVVIQPGTWVDYENKPPQKDLEPDLSQRPVVRLLINGKIETDVEILLTGFNMRTIVGSTSLIEGSMPVKNSPNRPLDGDFLGSGAFPWANKIVFVTPSSAINLLITESYVRQLKKTETKIKVDDTSVIDMRKTNPGTYYTKNYPTAREEININDLVTFGNGVSVLTIYQRKDVYPPALYGTYATATGANYLNPIDVVAPGTVKMFESTGNPDEDKKQLQDYQDTFPGTFGMSKNDDGELNALDKEGNLVPTAKVSVEDLYYKRMNDSNTKATGAKIQTGKNEVLALSMRNKEGKQWQIGKPNDTEIPLGATIETDKSDIYWEALLDALANNQRIDILGDDLRVVKKNLKNNILGETNNDKNDNWVLTLHGTGKSSVGGAFDAQGNITSADGFVASKLLYHIFGGTTGETGKGKAETKLFIAKKAPTINSKDAASPQEGDIGIGWYE